MACKMPPRFGNSGAFFPPLPCVHTTEINLTSRKHSDSHRDYLVY